jgi:FAD:protein FMN transferase
MKSNKYMIILYRAKVDQKINANINEDKTENSLNERLEPYFFEEPLFGGKVGFMLYDVEKDAAELIRPALMDEAKRLQKIFNFYDEQSELSELNRKREIDISDELLEVLLCALKYAELTAGEYDISQGKIILARKKGEREPKKSCSYKDILIQKGSAGKKNKVTLKNDDVLIDLGSIAKGYIADKLIDFLKESGVNSALIDARGDVAIYGDEEETIWIAHPRLEGESVGEITLKNGAVATSGDYKQYMVDYKHSHILNQKELISVTIVAESLMQADVIASAVFVTNGKTREQIISKAAANGCRIFTVDENINITKYNWRENI